MAVYWLECECELLLSLWFLDSEIIVGLSFSWNSWKRHRSQNTAPMHTLVVFIVINNNKYDDIKYLYIKTVSY